MTPEEEKGGKGTSNQCPEEERKTFPFFVSICVNARERKRVRSNFLALKFSQDEDMQTVSPLLKREEHTKELRLQLFFFFSRVRDDLCPAKQEGKMYKGNNAFDAANEQRDRLWN